MSYQLTIEPLGASIEVEEGQTLLDAALRQGIYLPHACGHGLCGTCKVQVCDGMVDHGAANPFALMDFERDEGMTLACCATLESDATVEADIDEDPDAQIIPVRDFVATVDRIEQLTPTLAPWVARSAEDRRIPNVRAVFLMAPAIVQAFEPGELARLEAPLSVVVGESDAIAPPASNSKVIVEANDNARLQALPLVGHYDFLADCTELSRERLGKLCEVNADKQVTHQAAIQQARSLFDSMLR